MAIKNKDGSVVCFSKPAPQMAEQIFWDKKEKVVMHNKFGQRYTRDELRVVEDPQPEPEEIKIVHKIEEVKSKPLHEDVIEIWCLPCVGITENVDELYGESYDKITYGDKFIFKARLLALEDLSMQFMAEANIEIPTQSVIYPKTASRRWWRVKGTKELKDFRAYLCSVSDYQPNFDA